MDISKMLTISMAHITEETDNELQHNPDKFEELFYYNEDWWGYMMQIPPHTTLEDIPEDLRMCIELARQNDCEWLQLDCDGEEVPELPTYDW